MNPAALTDILTEIAAAMRPDREPATQWNKVAEERAGNRIAVLTTRVMVDLAERSDMDTVAEVLARIAAQEGAFDTATRAFNDYRKRLAA